VFAQIKYSLRAYRQRLDLHIVDRRGNTHAETARSVEQMRKHRHYREHPAKDLENIGGVGGFFDDLEVCYGMAFDRKGDVLPLCSVDADNSLFVWSKQTIEELKRRMAP